MRSLLLIATAFAFLAAYLEAMSSNALATQTARISHKVVRSHTQPVAHNAANIPVTASNAQNAAQPLKLALPLNLSIPSQTSYFQHINEQRRSAINWFKPREEAEITYNAELVFDAEKGEEITGGKVNIRIPLS